MPSASCEPHMFTFIWSSSGKVTQTEQPRPESGAVTDLSCIYVRAGLISFLRHVEGFILWMRENSVPVSAAVCQEENILRIKYLEFN
jgi:hypothetical protein